MFCKSKKYYYFNEWRRSYCSLYQGKPVDGAPSKEFCTNEKFLSIWKYFLLKDGNLELSEDEEAHPRAEGGDEDGDEAGVEGDVVGDLVLQPELTPAGLGSLRVLVDDSNTTVWLPGHPLDLSAPVIALTQVADDDDSVDSEDREYQVLDIFLHELGRTLQG